MITFTISAVDPNFRDKNLLMQIHAAIIFQLKKSQSVLLKADSDKVCVTITGDQIHYEFNGLSPEHNARSEIMRYLFNELNEVLEKLGVRSAFKIPLHGYAVEENAKIIRLQDCSPSETKNHLMLDTFIPDSDIPDEFRCSITQQLIDSPVFIKGAPDRVYDKTQLKRYFFTKFQDDQVDPFTRKEVDPFVDILPKPDLKQLISVFVRQKIAEVLKQRLERCSTVKQKYLTPFPANKDQLSAAFRRAAAVNDLHAIPVFLENYAADIDSVDSNPASRKTALHLAVFAGHLEMARLLIKSGANSSVVDASGKSPIVYALESGDQNMIQIILGNIDLLKIRHAAQAGSQKAELPKISN